LKYFIASAGGNLKRLFSLIISILLLKSPTLCRSRESLYSTRRIANIKGNISNEVKITIYKERANQKSYKIELMDKDFELPPTNDSTFANGMEKAQNMTKTSLDDEGGKNE